MLSSTKSFPPTSPIGSRAILFVALNVLRLLSIVTLCLTFASQIVGIKADVDAVKAANAYNTRLDSAAYNSSQDYVDECEYIEYSAVPNQTGGVFWAELNRVFMLLFCLILLISELSLPTKAVARFYETYIPVLSMRHGVGILGAMQCLVAANILSKYVESFEQVTAWLLFIVGCLNVLIGLWQQEVAKEKRLIFSWENVTSLAPQSRAAYGAYKVYDEKVRPFAANKKTNEDASVNLKKSTSASSDSIPGSRHKSSASTENLISKNDVEAAAAYLNYVEPRLTVSTESTAVNSFEIPAPSERPSRSSSPGWRFGGFGFGRQGEKAAEERGFTISKPLSTLPRYATDKMGP